MSEVMVERKNEEVWRRGEKIREKRRKKDLRVFYLGSFS